MSVISKYCFSLSRTSIFKWIYYWGAGQWKADPLFEKFNTLEIHLMTMDILFTLKTFNSIILGTDLYTNIFLEASALQENESGLIKFLQNILDWRIECNNYEDYEVIYFKFANMFDRINASHINKEQKECCLKVLELLLQKINLLRAEYKSSKLGEIFDFLEIMRCKFDEVEALLRISHKLIDFKSSITDKRTQQVAKLQVTKSKLPLLDSYLKEADFVHSAFNKFITFTLDKAVNIFEDWVGKPLTLILENFLDVAAQYDSALLEVSELFLKMKEHKERSMQLAKIKTNHHFTPDSLWINLNRIFVRDEDKRNFALRVINAKKKY